VREAAIGVLIMVPDAPIGGRFVGRIPVRNLWLLMLYASDLARHKAGFDARLDEDIDNLPDLIAKLLSDEVERRLRRNLTRGYRGRSAAFTRVRGRIDILTTKRASYSVGAKCSAASTN